MYYRIIPDSGNRAGGSAIEVAANGGQYNIMVWVESARHGVKLDEATLEPQKIFANNWREKPAIKGTPPVIRIV